LLVSYYCAYFNPNNWGIGNFRNNSDNKKGGGTVITSKREFLNCYNTFQVMNRVMALDAGKKWIGIAYSDPLKMTASPAETYRRRSLEDDVIFILDKAAEKSVDEIIVGYPRFLTGEESRVMEEIRPLFAALKERFAHDVRWSEERLSSKEAERILLRRGYSPGEIRKNRDSFAAALILTWYLEERHGG